MFGRSFFYPVCYGLWLRLARLSYRNHFIISWWVLIAIISYSVASLFIESDKMGDSEDSVTLSPLFENINSGNPNIAILLSYCTPDNLDCCYVFPDGSTPLHMACKNTKILSQANVILALIDAYPPAVSSPNKFGYLPLHKAVSVASEEHISSIKLLIDASPDTISAQTLDGQSILHLAVTLPRKPSKSVLEYLYHREPMIAYISDSYGQLPLHKAVAKPRMEVDIVQMLIQSNPHALALKDSRGFNPIHWLCCRGNPNIDIMLLLTEEYREGLLELDCEGRTPLMRYILNHDKDADIESLLAELTEITREEKAEKHKLHNEAKGPRINRPKNSRQSSSRSLKKSPSRKMSMRQLF